MLIARITNIATVYADVNLKLAKLQRKAEEELKLG